MAAIPHDIQAVINRVDRDGNAAPLPRTNTPLDRYDSLLKSLFPREQIVNLTEFDYGRSFRYSIVLSQDPDAAALDRERVGRAVRRVGVLGAVDVAISTLAPLVHVKFVRFAVRGGEIAQEWSDAPFTDAQAETAETLLRALGQRGMKRIDADIAETIVPDVATDLHDLGETTVADCLFYG